LSECWTNSNATFPLWTGFNYFWEPSVVGKSGGVSIYGRSNFKCDKIDINHLICPDAHMEALMILSHTHHSIIITIYRHSSGNFHSFLESLENIFTCKSFNQNYKIIIMGDININILDSSNHSKSYQFFVNSFNFEFLFKEPTRVEKCSATCIDHFITQNQLTNEIDISPCDFSITDHKCFNISIPINNKMKTTTSYQRSFSENNIQNFYLKVSKENWFDKISIINDIDTNIDHFLNMIIKCYNHSFPLSPRKNQNISTPWINKSIKNLVNKKRVLLKRINKHNKPSDRIKLKQTSKCLKNEIKHSKNTFFSKAFVTGSSKEKWNKIRKFAAINDKNVVNSTSLHSDDLANYFSTILSVNEKDPPLQCIDAKPNTFYAFPTSESEILEIILSLKNKKCHHFLDIPLFLWRIAAKPISEPLTFLSNQMFTSATFPTICKQSHLTPIFKKGDNNMPENYRPVSSLHNLSKIFERLLLKRMTHFINLNNLLPDCQYGFRQNFSTKDAVLSLLLKIEKNGSKNLKTCCIFLDLSKAFDKVNHSLLLHNLRMMGFRGLFGNLLESFLSNRSFRTKFNGNFSNQFKITRGVPQGSIISPMLYSLYVSDMQKIGADIIQYADDSTILIPYRHVEDLQEKINIIGERVNNYINSKNLSLNTNKTEIMLFGETHTKTLDFINNKIPVAQHTKFLGVHIDTKRKFHTHAHLSILPNIRKMMKYFYFLSSATSRATKKLLFYSFILPHIHYSIPFILLCDNTLLTLINRTYNKALKLLYSLPLRYPTKDLPSFTNIPSLSSIINKHSAILAHTLFYSPLPAHNIFFIRTKRLNFLLDSHKDRRSIHNHICEVWNRLPIKQKVISTKHAFRKTIT